MPIVYDRLIQKMKDAGFNSSTAKQTHIIGQQTYKEIMSGGSITIKSLERLCEYFGCQPGDIIEYRKE